MIQSGKVFLIDLDYGLVNSLWYWYLFNDNVDGLVQDCSIFSEFYSGDTAVLL